MSRTRTSTRIYALALRAFPFRHRALYAPEMVETFERELAARAREQGRWRALWFVVAACLDAISAGLGERRRDRRLGLMPPRAHLLAAFGGDLLHATRSLAKARGFTTVCVLSLGVGLGTVIAIILIMRSIFGPPPGVSDKGLVELLIEPRGELLAQVGYPFIETWSYPDYVEVRGADTGMAITGWTLGESVLKPRDGEDGAVRLPTMYVSPNYFGTVGVRLARGPGFDPATEDRPAGQPVVVIGHRLWQNRLGANPSIVGSTITLNRVEHVVVGVAPERFGGHLSPEHTADIQVWVPLGQHPRLQAQSADDVRMNRDVDWLRILGRLSPGTSREQASATVASVMSGVAERYPKSNRFKVATVEQYTAMGAAVTGEVVVVQAMFVGVSGLVLLVVCLNISGMVLVRTATRERELAVRQAVGASRIRLIQYLLSESLVLALAGGGLAAAVLFGVPAALLAWFDTWNPDLDGLRLDGWLVLTCVGLCFVTSLVFGLLPAIRFSRPALVSALKDSVGGGRRRVGRVHRWTAAIQAGIAVPFLVIGGVRLDQMRTTAAAELGFEPKALFAARLDLAATKADEDRRASMLRTALANLEQAAGVTSVTVADGLPLDFDRREVRVSREGDETAVVWAHTTRVGEGYLPTMGIRLVRGRDITREDRAGSEPVAVISEPLAAQLFTSGAAALGRRLSFTVEGNTKQTFTIVGVTEDVVTSQMSTTRPQLFVPLAQHPAPRVVLIARGSESAAGASMTPAFRNAVAEIDPDFINTIVVSGDQLVRKSIRDLMMHSILTGVCGAVALTLAALGVAGVIGFMVATRTREIGVRVALGATRGRVMATILRDAVKLVVPGILFGLVIAVLWVRLADPSWYPLGGVEPLVYAAAAATAMLIAMLAGLPSARRAASVEPVNAMRAE